MSEATSMPTATPSRLSPARAVAKRLGLRYVTTAELTIRRRRLGERFSYVSADGRTLRDPAIRRRLKSLAVPPAYEDVLYAEDQAAHIQAIGRDAAGRLQYRYHPDWRQVRETRKARRLARLVEVLPRIRRSVGRHLAANEPKRELALAAVIELVACSAIRPGSESYARANGTRGAATLLKSNVTVSGATVALAFRAKGGKDVRKECRAPRLAAAIDVLRALPGRRIFQYRADDGAARIVTTADVNGFLREIAGVNISLKDFRTLCASTAALAALARMAPAASQRGRRRQVREAVTAISADLANTPAICRKSYVHEAVVTAFENGKLTRFGAKLKGCRSAARREELLGQVIAEAAV